MNVDPSPAPTLVTLELGPTYQERINDLHRQADEAGAEHQRRMSERRRRAGADAMFIADDPRLNDALTRISADLRDLTSPGAGLCREHQNRTVDTWLGIDRDVACCLWGLQEGIRKGRLVITNPELLDDIAGDETREKLDRLHAGILRNTVADRVDEISSRLVPDLQAIAAGGGEPVRKLREVLRQVLGDAGDDDGPAASTVTATGPVDDGRSSSGDRRRRRRW